MTKFPFVENAWIIYGVSKARKVDIDVAFDMFRSDIHHGVNFNTQLDDVDFVALKSQWDMLNGDIRGDAITSWREFFNKNSKKLTDAWVAQDKDVFQKIVDNA